VAWVSERKDVLSAFLGLLALLAYARYARRPQWGPYLLTLFLYCLSLLSKSMLVTFPFLLLLLDFWPLCRWRLTFDVGESNAFDSCYPPRSFLFLVLEKLPLLALSAATCAVTFLVQRQGGAMRTTAEVPVAARLANLPVAYLRYLGKMVWFHSLAVDYPFPAAWPAPAVIAAVMALVTVTAFALWRIRREPWLAVGWFWFLGMLAPVIGLVQVGNQSMADRYTYLPMIGILILAAWSLPARPMALPIPRLLAALAAAVVLAILCRFTQIQVGYWENTVSLMTHAIEVTKGNYAAETNLAQALGIMGDMDGAIEHYGKALAIKPRSALLHNNYGMVMMIVGNQAAAAAEYRQSLRLDPDLPEALNNLGYLLTCPGPLRDIPAAIEDFRHALRVRPGYADAQVNFGLALAAMGDSVGAIRCYQQALRSEPDHAYAHFNLGQALLKLGQSTTAIGHLREAVRLSPQNANFQQALAQAFKGGSFSGQK
jgi:Flp pilus assembly protein TadD